MTNKESLEAILIKKCEHHNKRVEKMNKGIEEKNYPQANHEASCAHYIMSQIEAITQRLGELQLNLRDDV